MTPQSHSASLRQLSNAGLIAFRVEFTTWFHDGGWRVLNENGVKVLSASPVLDGQRVHVVEVSRPVVGAGVCVRIDENHGIETKHFNGEVEQVYWCAPDVAVVVATMSPPET